MGTELEFVPWAETCFTRSAEGYTYKVCPFGQATQDSVVLGEWDGWAEGRRAMRFKGGATCWNGPARSLVVHLVCGAAAEELLRVEEPSRCE